MLAGFWLELGGSQATPEIVGEGSLRSAFSVTELATASIAVAADAVADLIEAGGGARPHVTADRRLASLWFGTAIRPHGWSIPPAWDAVAGDYRTDDGWIRLHTNAPHHRAAALAVLGVPADREAVAAAVRRWTADALEAAVVGRGGCAASMRSAAAWAVHEQGASVAREPLVWRLVTDDTAGSRPIDPARPLAGIKVLDLTRVLAGPVSTRFLAGFGAEVLRLDPPEWEEPPVVPDVTLGKRCARLDLRNEAGLAQFCALLAEADVLVHGYRPGALTGLGLDAAERRRIRPGLIDVSLDAYGWTGPWQGRRGFDSLVQMSSGIAEAGMQAFGADKPTPLPVQALDHATGYVMAATAIRGLVERQRTGRGSEARTSLARIAALLTGAPRTEPAPAMPPAGDDDFSDTPEHTQWGAAERLRPPVEVDGAPMRWDSPASPLGSASPTWS